MPVTSVTITAACSAVRIGMSPRTGAPGACSTSSRAEFTGRKVRSDVSTIAQPDSVRKKPACIARIARSHYCSASSRSTFVVQVAQPFSAISADVLCELCGQSLSFPPLSRPIYRRPYFRRTTLVRPNLNALWVCPGKPSAYLPLAFLTELDKTSLVSTYRKKRGCPRPLQYLES